MDNHIVIESLNNIKQQKADVYGIFDINILYTCVPLGKTVNTKADDVYSNENSSIFNKSKLTKIVFKNILLTCSESKFVSKVLNHKDGIPIGPFQLTRMLVR